MSYVDMIMDEVAMIEYEYELDHEAENADIACELRSFAERNICDENY